MDKLARDYADEVHFLFVYVREAHPDTHPEPAHKSIEQKFEQARMMRDRHGTPRTIVVDALEGEVHRLYGGMPNMSWIIDAAGIIAYKAAWTSEMDIRPAVQDVLELREFKRDGTAVFYKETMSINPTRRKSFLENGGQAAARPGQPAAVPGGAPAPTAGG